MLALAPLIDSFKFRVGETWLSSWTTPLITIGVYLTTLKAIKLHVASRKKPYDLRKVIAAYNLALSIGSGLLLAFLGAEISGLIQSSSFFELWCDSEDAFGTGKHHFYYYLNYLFKYVELLDTVFLCLRAKPTPFLHVYHHSATLLLCWTQLASENCVQWVPILLNLLVHVVMYYYYHRVALGHRVSWKKYVTRLQITQFVLALCLCTPPYLSRNVWHLENHVWPGILGGVGYKCHGEFLTGTFGVGILLSYLVLFIRFYGYTYKKAVSKSGDANAINTTTTAINATDATKAINAINAVTKKTVKHD